MRFTITKSGDDLEALTADAVKALSKANRDVGRDIARVARVAVLADVRASRGGLSFSGMKTRLGAKASKPYASANGVKVFLVAKPAGPWSISEYGAIGHDIEPKVSRRGERHALLFDGLYSAHVDHPGTSGRPYWRGAEPALDRAVFEQIEDTFDEALED